MPVVTMMVAAAVLVLVEMAGVLLAVVPVVVVDPCATPVAQLLASRGTRSACGWKRWRTCGCWARRITSQGAPAAILASSQGSGAWGATGRRGGSPSAEMVVLAMVVVAAAAAGGAPMCACRRRGTTSPGWRRGCLRLGSCTAN